MSHTAEMFDVNGGEMVVLAGIAMVILGPEKLPGYAAQAARLLRQLREMADGAKDQLRDQMGPEFEDLDWKNLDPRQYDPRRMVREAFATHDDDSDEDDRDVDSTSGRTDSADSDRDPADPVTPAGAAAFDRAAFDVDAT